MAKGKKKHSFLKILLILVLLAGAMELIFGGKSTQAPKTVPAPAATQAIVETSEPTSKPIENQTEEPTASPTAESSGIVITLNASEAGEYGKRLALNKGTADELSFFGYFLPAGTYDVSIYIGSKTAQITVYKPEIEKVDGFEEFPLGSCSPIVLMSADDVKQIIVGDGEFIKISGEGVYVFRAVE